MRQRKNGVILSMFRFRTSGPLIAAVLVLGLLAIPRLRLPYEGVTQVAFGHPDETVLSPATTTATVTLTLTASSTATLTPVPTDTATLTPTASVTATSTSPPPATSTPTPTTVPTATASATPPAPPTGRHSLSVRVFLDYRCDRYFQTNVDKPVGAARVTIDFPDGSSATRETTLFGMVYFSGIDASGGLTVSVELPRNFRGYKLGSCPGSPTSIGLEPGDFRFGFEFVSFGATVRGELAGP